MKKHPSDGRVLLHAVSGNNLRPRSPGYETYERSSLGKALPRRRGRMQRPRFFRSGRNFKPAAVAAQKFRAPQGGAKR